MIRAMITIGFGLTRFIYVCHRYGVHCPRFDAIWYLFFGLYIQISSGMNERLRTMTVPKMF